MGRVPGVWKDSGTGIHRQRLPNPCMAVARFAALPVCARGISPYPLSERAGQNMINKQQLAVRALMAINYAAWQQNVLGSAVKHTQTQTRVSAKRVCDKNSKMVSNYETDQI
ncbi:MAG: hypothetical protein HKL95_08090 [Phycisphaerae bacterium]|nr:hypothetical protein [Phycisphaerae bacterium]